MSLKVWMLDGQGGWLFSQGWRAFGRDLISRGFAVSAGWSAKYPVDIALDISRSGADKVAVLGYSLGGNGATWVADRSELHQNIDLLVAYDPTLNAPMKPLKRNVKRAICYRQTSYLGTSLLFGRAVLENAPGGPLPEIYNISTDHLLVQFRSDLHARTITALETLR